MGYLHEACDVGALHVVDVAVGLCAVFHTLLVDVVHDVVEFFVDFFGAPLQVHCILAHFESGGSDTSGIYCLAGGIDGVGLDEVVDGLGGTAHVADLGHHFHAVVDKHACVVAVELVLCGTW